MAVAFTTALSALHRTTGTFLAGNNDFTIMYWVFTTGDPATGGNYRTYHQLMEAGVAYFGLYGLGDGTNRFAITADDGGGGVNSEFIPYQIDSAYHIALVYDNTAKTLKFYVNLDLLDTLTGIDFSAVTFDDEVLANDGFSITELAIQNYRSYQRALTLDQICIECAGNTAVSATNLFCDTPLSGSTDLLDQSGNFRDWTKIGTIFTYSNQVNFISGHANDSELTPEIITALPYFAVQRVDDAGVTKDAWFKFTSTSSEVLSGVYLKGSSAYGAESGVWIDADADTNLVYTGDPDLLFDLTLLAERQYYFGAFSTDGDHVPSVLLVSLVLGPINLPVPRGSIFIRGGTGSITSGMGNTGYIGLDAGYINPTTGEIFSFKTQFLNGETGDYLPSGVLCFADDDLVLGDECYWILYNPDLSEIARVAWNWTGSLDGSYQRLPVNRASREQGIFYLGSGGNNSPTPDVNSKYTTLSPDGTLGVEVTLPGAWIGMSSIAASPDGTYVYVAGLSKVGVTPGAIMRYNTLTGVFDSDLAAKYVLSGFTWQVIDMLVMSNGDVIALYQKPSNPDFFVRRYNSSGTLLATYTPPVLPYSDTDHRLGYADDDSLTFWLFAHVDDFTNNNSYSYIVNINAVTLVAISSITPPDAFYTFYEQGGAPEYRFVTSDSCPIVLILTPSVPPGNPLSGIYQIVPDKRNDTLWVSFDPEETEDVAIPDPFFKTGLIGK